MRSFTIYGDPQGKQRPRHGKGFTYTPKATISYEQEIKQAYMMAHRNEHMFEQGTPVAIRVTACMQIPASTSKKKAALMKCGEIRPTKKPDWDNIGKIVTDALNGLAYYDDAQVVDAHVVKRYAERPMVTVEIEEVIYDRK